MNLEFWAPTLVGLGVNVAMLAFVLGKLFGKVDANANTVAANANVVTAMDDRISRQDDKLNKLTVALTVVTATCATYFAQNPSTVAVDALRNVLEDLENL